LGEPEQEAHLKYHILKRPIRVGEIFRGQSIHVSTNLTDRIFTNITSGQQVILTKQPNDAVVLTSGSATRSTIVQQDIPWEGGIIQVIDSVMRIPDKLPEIVPNAYKDLTVFLSALYTTNLVYDFTSMDDVTIFAPHNNAFSPVWDVLEEMSLEEIARVLRYHLVPSNVTYSWELKNGSSTTTYEGVGDMVITRHNNFIYVNSAQLMQQDILLPNGVMHIIDNVLSPDHTDARPDFSLEAQNPVITPMDDTDKDQPLFSKPVVMGGPRHTSTNGGMPAARCTGMAGAGIGIGLAVGAMVMGI